MLIFLKAVNKNKEIFIHFSNVNGISVGNQIIKTQTAPTFHSLKIGNRAISHYKQQAPFGKTVNSFPSDISLRQTEPSTVRQETI